MPIDGDYPGDLECALGCFLIINDETEMAAVIRALIPSLLKRDELIAQIDKCRREFTFAA